MIELLRFKSIQKYTENNKVVNFHFFSRQTHTELMSMYYVLGRRFFLFIFKVY